MPGKQRTRYYLSFLLSALLVIVGVQGTAFAFDRNHPVGGEDYNQYLPLVERNIPLGIHGWVTEGASPAPNIYLELRFYNGSTWSTKATTTTDSKGMFKFTGIDNLGANQVYYVRYPNTEENDNRLFVWGTDGITSYNGEDVHIGDFNIENVWQTSPAPGATVALPVTFNWAIRTDSPTDSYEFNLYDPNDGDPWFWTDPPLGFVSSYQLNALPGGFEFGTPYGWFLWVYDGKGGYGISYYFFWVEFTNTMNPAAAPDKAPVPVNDFIDLERFDLPDVVQNRND